MLWNKPVSNNVPRQPEEFSHFIHSLDKHFSQKEHSLGHQMRGQETPMAFRIRLGRESLSLFVAPKPVWGSGTEDRREPGGGGTGELNPDPSRQSRAAHAFQSGALGSQTGGGGRHLSPLPAPVPALLCRQWSPLPGPCPPYCSENPGTYLWHKPGRMENRWVWPLSSQGRVLPCSPEQTPRMKPQQQGVGA